MKPYKFVNWSSLSFSCAHSSFNSPVTARTELTPIRSSGTAQCMQTKPNPLSPSAPGQRGTK